MHYNIALGVAKELIFFIKKLCNAGTGMRRGYLNPSGTRMRFNFSSLLGKYMRIEYGDEEGKTCLRPIAMPNGNDLSMLLNLKVNQVMD